MTVSLISVHNIIIIIIIILIIIIKVYYFLFDKPVQCNDRTH